MEQQQKPRVSISSPVTRPQIIHQNIYRPQSVLSTASTVSSVPVTTPCSKFAPNSAEPRSAPPESPVRERQVHDRR